MPRLIAAFALATFATAPLATPAAAQNRGESEEKALDWSGVVPAGRTVVVRNVNGQITVRRADGPRASIVATKVWRRGRPERVRVELRRSGGESGDVIACAFWNETATCDETGYRNGSNSRNWNDGDSPGDVQVEFEVRLPAGVHLATSSVNGGVSVDGASGRVEAETVNGQVVARSTAGPVRAKTVNGGIDVTMGTALTEDVEYETVNGSIALSIPDGLDADLTMKTVNGSVSTDFPMTVSGRINPKRLSGTLGKGGRRLSLETVNGSVRLRKL